jgi:biotin carboxyl carrier protein
MLATPRFTNESNRTLKMKLKAKLHDHEHDLELKLSEDRAAVQVDGREYQLAVRQPAPGVVLLQSENRVYECRVESHLQHGGVFDVTLRGRTYTIGIADPKRLRSGENSHRHDHGSAEITAPMPGKVVRVLVEVGAEVEAGAGILVVEAMKMQNELKTPRAGVVVAIGAKTGDTVNAGDVLAVVE